MTNGITIGGCYPPTWPRPPKPPVPEPEPDSLDEQVDWMTYSHPELYSMVHTGLDLTGAMATSAKWARLGDELADIGDELVRLMNATGQAWQGDSADLARESVSALAEWSQETSFRATEVSACVTVQVDNATNARNSMPAPPYQTDVPTELPSMQTAFVSGDFETAAPLVSDPAGYTRQERALHQQAATTMQQFQDSSRDVYATVPQFAPPNLRRTPRVGPPDQPPPPQPPPIPQPPVPPVPPVTRNPVSGGPAPRATPGPAVPPGSATPRPAAPLGSGGGTGTAEPASTRPAAAASAAGRPGTAAPGMGGVPMGGHGGQGGDEDTAHKNKYAKGEDDIWGLDEQQAMPPVIGEVNRRA